LHGGQVDIVFNGSGGVALERFFKSRGLAVRKVTRQEAREGPGNCLEALANRRNGEKRLRQREMLGKMVELEALGESSAETKKGKSLNEMFILPFCQPARPTATRAASP
jgi:hypothetical protein